MLSRRSAWLLFGFVLFVLVGYVLYPSLRTFVLGLEPERLERLFASRRSANVRALVNSVLVSLSLYTVDGYACATSGRRRRTASF